MKQNGTRPLLTAAKLVLTAGAVLAGIYAFAEFTPREAFVVGEFFAAVPGQRFVSSSGSVRACRINALTTVSVSLFGTLASIT